jgi:hypothetical protein
MAKVKANNEVSNEVNNNNEEVLEVVEAVETTNGEVVEEVEEEEDEANERELSSRLSEIWDGLHKAASGLIGLSPANKKFVALNLEIFNLRNERTKELAAIKKLEREREIKQQQDQLLQLVATFEAAIMEESKYYFLNVYDKQPDEETTNNLNGLTAYKVEAREAVNNELLKRFTPTRQATTTSASGEPKQPKSAPDENNAIIIAYNEAVAKGISGIQAYIQQATGAPRSTVWHTVNNYVKANKLEKAY